MRLPCVVLALLLAACGSSSPPDAGADAGADASLDAGTDSGPARVDMGFDAASLGTCPLDAATDWDASVVRAYVPLESASREEDRAFYVLTLLEGTAGVTAGLAADPTFSAETTARRDALAGLPTSCTADAACVRGALVTSDAALPGLLDAVVAQLGADGALATVAGAMRASGDFARYDLRGDADDVLVREALAEAHADLAAGFDTYAAGELPVAMLDTVVATEAADASSVDAFWQPLARVLYAAMLADGRDEAIRYEPLTTGENAAALAALATIDFSRFPYAAMIVPGEGPMDTTTRLDPYGKMRCDLAAARYAAGLAPVILTTGGHVHPDRTVYSEAIEMKHYLMSTYAIPESAILVDPYARHTTTNLRNATRELLHAGIPPASTVLIVSDAIQTAYIRGDAFALRCDAELHFRPWRGLDARTATDTCMTLEPVSLTTDAADLLDP